MTTVREYVRLALERSEHLGHLALERYRALSTAGKLAVWLWASLHVLFGVLFWLIGPERIFASFAGLADRVRDLPLGWLVLSLVIVVTSIPPLVGYGTAQTLVGFAYGVLPGFYISASSCLVGGAVAFLVVRRLIGLFAPYIQRDKTFAALSRAVRVKGLPLIVLLRLCPFPYPYSNAFFASIETVSLQEFMLATLAITPKLLLHVFIGHRTYLFADPTSRHKMDSTTRWINGIFMVVGTLLGVGTSWYLYKLTMRYVEEAAEGEEDEQDALEAGLLQDVDELLDDADVFDDSDGGSSATKAHDDGTRNADQVADSTLYASPRVPEGALLDVGDSSAPDSTLEPPLRPRVSISYPRGAGPSRPSDLIDTEAEAEAEAGGEGEADGWGDAFSDYSAREGLRPSIELDSISIGRSPPPLPRTGSVGAKGHARGDSAAWGLNDDDGGDGGCGGGDEEGEESAPLDMEPVAQATLGFNGREKKRID
ncbi:hypothetical protein JCM3774_005249 [Rhodotorula dairenensis]